MSIPPRRPGASCVLSEFTSRQWLTLLTVQLCTILFGITVTSVAVILPQMKGALAATQDQIAWVLTLNLVATAAASVACGTATSLETLLVFRVVQGALGAPIFPMGQSIILARFERRHHPIAVMMWGVGGVMGPILGPTFGGLVADVLDWRWSFFMILAECALAAGAFYLFVVHASFATSPLFEGATFRDRNFVLGAGFALVMGMLQFTPMVLFPALLQELRGYPESIVGYLISMRGVGNFLSFFVVAQLTRLDARATLAAGLLIQAGAAAWMGVLDLNMTFEQVLWTNLMHGFGFGLAYTPMAVLAFSTLEPRLLTQGNAIFSLLRMLGSSLFIAVILVVFVRSAAEAYAHLSAGVTMFSTDSILAWIDRFGDLGDPVLHARLGEEVRSQAAMIGYVNSFNLLALVPAVAAPAVLLFKRRA